MKKKIALILTLVASFSSIVQGASNNSVSTQQYVMIEKSLANADFLIEPINEVATGSSIIITFTNGIVFPQDVIDGTSNDTKEIGYNKDGYQYKVNGANWDKNDGFHTVMPDINSAKLPYEIKRLNDHEIQVFLCDLPDAFANNSLKEINGISRNAYYAIPIVAYGEKEGRVTASIDPNASSITGGSIGTLNDNTGTTTTEITTETTTAITESTTETTTQNSNKNSISVEVQIGSKTMNVIANNTTFPSQIDVAPYIQLASNSTMIPLRAVSNGLGISDNNIKWNPNTKTVIIEYKNNTVQFTIGSNKMLVNGVEQTMSYGVVAEIKESRTFIPFRALGDAFGIDVSWDANNKIAKYTY